MKFQVPQFIETETKIVGPLTWKQFIWVAVGVGLLLILFRFLAGFWLILVSLIVTAVFGSLAFLRIEETTLIEYLMKALGFALGPKKYLFKKENGTTY
ncbi:MAG: PrgI family protein [Parcubacteria group bacterium]|nr:PrgI family protein [Parcubacteria group bacterium]